MIATFNGVSTNLVVDLFHKDYAVNNRALVIAVVVISALGLAATPVGGPLFVTGALAHVWDVPECSAGFIARDALIHEILRRAAGGRPVVLHGPGGMGKSELAKAVARACRRKAKVAWWIDAENPDLIGKRFQELAHLLGAPEFDCEDPLRARRAVHERLRRRANWLMVFDNARIDQNLMGWVPSGGGIVLITARSADRSQLTEEVAVPGLDEDVAVALLTDRVHGLSPDEARQVARRLDGLPLALTQAACVLAGGTMSVPGYLAELEHHADEILDQGAPAFHGSRTLLTTVSLSRLVAEERDPVSGLLLDALAHLGPDPVPMSWITLAADRPPGLPGALGPALHESPSRREALRRALKDVGLTQEPGRGLYVVHRLTSDIVRAGHHHGQQGGVCAHARASALMITTAAAEHASGPGSQEVWNQIVGHIVTQDLEQTDDPQLRRTACDAALHLSRRGDHRASLALAQRLHHAWSRRAELGPDHLDTLIAEQHVARSLMALGEYARASEWCEGTWRRRRATLGEDHPEVLQAANDLASSLLALSDAAMTMASALAPPNSIARLIAGTSDQDERVVERWRVALGEDRLEMLRWADDPVAQLLALREKVLTEARELDKDAWQRRVRTLGESHQDTLASMNNLAGDLYALGDYKSARDMDQRTLELYRIKLGEDHSDTLTSATNLAADLRALGEPAAARALDADTLERRRRLLGDDHPDTRHSVSCLATDINLLRTP